MELLSPIAKNVSADSRIPPRLPEAPLKEATEIFGCVYDVQGEVTSKKEKTPQFPGAMSFRAGTSGARQFWRLFPLHVTNVNQLTALTTGSTSGVEQQIISSIKTFRNKN